jgi:hypothetical protein
MQENASLKNQRYRGIARPEELCAKWAERKQKTRLKEAQD